MIPVNETSREQLVEMMAKCRHTCKQKMEENDSIEIPDEYKHLGGYNDTIVDSFGVDYNFCDLKSGKTGKANQMFLSVSTLGKKQNKIVPQLTEVGFEKMKIPNKIYAAILTNRKKKLKSGQKWEIEYCSEGLQNCNMIYESEVAQECHVVSSEKYWLLDLDESTKKSLYRLLVPLVEQWIGNKFTLIGYNVYGLRKYTRGAYLAGTFQYLLNMLEI